VADSVLKKGLKKAKNPFFLSSEGPKTECRQGCKPFSEQKGHFLMIKMAEKAVLIA
jgi:hypothetical protein